VGRFPGGRHDIARHWSPMNTHNNGVIGLDTTVVFLVHNDTDNLNK